MTKEFKIMCMLLETLNEMGELADTQHYEIERLENENEQLKNDVTKTNNLCNQYQEQNKKLIEDLEKTDADLAKLQKGKYKQK